MRRIGAPARPGAVLGLLRGLTAALDVTQSYLDVMTPYARRALRLRGPGAGEGQGAGGWGARGVDRLGGVRELVDELLASGAALGCQVTAGPRREVLERGGSFGARRGFWSAAGLLECCGSFGARREFLTTAGVFDHGGSF